jgi:hypothetical protein
MAEKRALNFPRWVEAALIVLLLVMAAVEYVNGQWAWTAIFGVAGVAFGVSLGVRLMTGDKNGGK